MKQLIALALAVLAFGAVAADNKKEVAAQHSSKQSTVDVSKAGTLDLKIIPNGAIAVFTGKQPKSTSCSGACSGVSVGSWTCSDAYPYCGLDCTKNPPYKYCYHE